MRRLVSLRAPPPSCAFAPFSVGEVDQDDAEHAPPSAGHLEVLLRAYAKDPMPADALAREEACVALVQCAVADARTAWAGQRALAVHARQLLLGCIDADFSKQILFFSAF